MADYKAGRWVIGIIIYYFFLFLTVFLISSSIRSMGSQDQYLDIEDPGFQEQGNLFTSGAVNNRCEGKGGSRAMNFLGNIQCNQLRLDDYDINGCNNITGCVWVNDTDLFGINILPAGCTQQVNLTNMSIDPGLNSYCESSGLQEEGLCFTFQCDWVNQNQIAERERGSVNSLSQIWQTVKFVTTFRADLELGQYNWVFSFVFFYIPLVFLIISIFFVFWPF